MTPVDVEWLMDLPEVTEIERRRKAYRIACKLVYSPILEHEEERELRCTLDELKESRVSKQTP